MRLLIARISNPASVSADVSGLRLGKASAFWIRPGISVPTPAGEATLTEVAEYDARAAVAPGSTPDSPHAVRRRSELSQLYLGKNDSSDTCHERLALG